MQKEIKYNGFTATPSDYESPDGDLAALINLVQEDGQLKPVLPATQLFTLPDGYKPIFIHKTAAFTHYIIQHDDTSTDPPTIQLYWIPKPQPGTVIDVTDFTPTNLLHTFDTLNDINAIGNTLVVLAGDGMHYLLWKNDTVHYKYLGTHIPELSISFGLQGKVKHSDPFTPTGTPEEKSETIMAQANKFIEENQTKSGRFILPFFIRYAYRLYDGTSFTMQSAPVLMVASAGVAPNVICENYNPINYGRCEVVAIRSYLDYIVTSSSQLNALKEWSDIIASVDVFISAPIYTYDQSAEGITGINSINNFRGSFSVFYQDDQNTTLLPESTYPKRYQKKSLLQALIMECGSNTITHDEITFNGYVILPAKTEDRVKEEIRNCSTFYLLRSFKLDELVTDARTKIEIAEDYLQSLTSREVLKDDYDSHDQLIPKFSFIYNNRLNLANIKKSLYNGYPYKSLIQYTNGLVTYYTDSTSPTIEDFTSPLKVFIFINQDGKDIIVANDWENDVLCPYSRPLYLYYTNPNAYKAVIGVILGTGDIGTYYELPLERHNYLNGAFYFNGWENPSTSSQSQQVSNDKTISLPNKIYTSEVNNPFYFPVKGINTIGTGEIKGICAAVKAMSQGQYGQFPLYAFTDEGVWTLEVAKDGTFGEIPPPVTRDVCINPYSITQLDSTVLFATDRGIMMLSGSSSICISEVLDSINPFTIEQLPNSNAIAGLNGFNVFDFNYAPFRQFIKECRMIYDYTNQRIIVFNPSTETVSEVTRRRYSYAYVYSLKSKQWGMMKAHLNDNINSYPDALAYTDTNTVINLSDPDDNAILQGLKGMLITRPLKLDAPDVLKTIDTIIQRGYFRKGSVSCVLLGSRDLFNWQIIYSSNDHYLRGFRGTPYKYFRIVIYCDMQKDESLFGCTVQYTPRLTDQPR